MRSTPFKGDVYVSNLPNDVTEEQLAELFDAYGLVLGVVIARPFGTERPPIGHVMLAPQKAAEEAIRALDGQSVGGRKISVAKPVERAKSAKNASKPGRGPARARPAAASPAHPPAKAATPARPPRPVIVEVRRRIPSRSKTT